MVRVLVTRPNQALVVSNQILLHEGSRVGVVVSNQVVVGSSSIESSSSLTQLGSTLDIERNPHEILSFT